MVDKTLIRPNFWGGTLGGGGWLTSHKKNGGAAWESAGIDHSLKVCELPENLDPAAQFFGTNMDQQNPWRIHGAIVYLPTWKPYKYHTWILWERKAPAFGILAHRKLRIVIEPKYLGVLFRWLYTPIIIRQGDRIHIFITEPNKSPSVCLKKNVVNKLCNNSNPINFEHVWFLVTCNIFPYVGWVTLA